MPDIPTFVEDLESLDRTAQILGQLLEDGASLAYAITTNPTKEVLEQASQWNDSVDTAIGECAFRNIRIALARAIAPVPVGDVIAGFNARQEASQQARDILRAEKTRIGAAIDRHERASRTATYGEYGIKPAGEVLLNGTEIVGLQPQTKKLLIQFLEKETHTLSLQSIKNHIWGEEDGLHRLDEDVHKLISKLNSKLPRINRERRIRLTDNSTESYVLHSE